MCKFNPKNKGKRFDPCIKNLIKYLKSISVPTVSCCCGHGKYPMTIVIWDRYVEGAVEILTQTKIPRKRRYYKKDKQGYYYIPEVI